MSSEPDRLKALFREKTLARVVAIAAFLGLLWVFRHLWATLLFFVAFERSIRWIEGFVFARTGWARKRIVLGVVASYLLVFATFVAVSVMTGFEKWRYMQDASADFLDDLKMHPLWVKYHHHLGDVEALMGHAKAYAGQAISVATAVGRFFVQATIGFVLGVVYRLEAHELDLFEDKIDQKSLVGRVLRWTEHTADAVSVTMQLQVVVAAFNTVTTLPVLLFLGIPHVPSLMALVFVSALVPVIGNLVAGTVLCLMAYQAKGFLGVGIFVVVTFLLHKVESYYLSPRLTARHVRVPGFVLIVSLIAFEHVFGFAGVFMSFPALFIASRIRAEFLEEDGVLPPETVTPGKSLAPNISVTVGPSEPGEPAARPSSPPTVKPSGKIASAVAPETPAPVAERPSAPDAPPITKPSGTLEAAEPSGGDDTGEGNTA